MPLRRPSLLPRSLMLRRRLTPREWVWVHQWAACLLLAGCWGSVAALAALASSPWNTLLTVVGGTGATVFASIAVFSAFIQFDDAQARPAKRRERVLQDRARRRRDHRGQNNWRELRGLHPQYGVLIRREGNELHFRVVRYEPCYRSRLFNYFVPWEHEHVRWDARAGSWRTEGASLRVSRFDTDTLMEAYCEASEAARLMEEQAVEQETRKLALDGIAMAFTPPSGRTANTEQLNAIRERVQIRRLLDPPAKEEPTEPPAEPARPRPEPSHYGW